MVESFSAMANTRTAEVLEAAFRKELSDEWHIERELTFAGIRPDLLLVHPNRGVVVISVVQLGDNFSFGTYDKDVELRNNWDSISDEQKVLHGNTPYGPGWAGLADPRDLLLDWREELHGFFSGLIDRDQKRLLRAVMIVVHDAEPESKDKVFGSMGQQNRANLNVEWINTLERSIDDLDTKALVTRVVPQAFVDESAMPDYIWSRLKREVLGTEDAVMGMAPPPDFNFDPQQQKILEYLSAPGLKRYRGPAGSGKTLIMARRVADAVLNGERVLVVTYNKTLCQMIRTRALFFINENVSDIDQRNKNTNLFNERTFITWQDRWWLRVCSATGQGKTRRRIYAEAFNKAGGDEDSGVAKLYVEETIPPVVLEGLKRAPRNSGSLLFYDVVMADEAQNMLPDNWECLKEAAVAETGTVVVIADPTQSLYGSRPWTDQRMKGFSNNPWRQMKASYRLPDDYVEFIAEFLKRFPPEDEVIPPSSTGKRQLSSSTLFRISPPKGGFPRDAIAAAIHYALNTLNFLPHQIVFLVPTKKRGNATVALLRQQGIEVTHTFEDENKPAFGTTSNVRGSTFHSYAGWESPCVIVDPGFSPLQTNTNGLFYSGLTRLAHRDIGSALIVIESDDHPYKQLIAQHCEEIPNQ
jgi:hypothetical protein